jgi:tryptophanyl-tRNA synthetase
MELFDNTHSFVDLGCGDGSYTKTLIKNGYKCIGYDGNPLTPIIAEGCFILDLSKPINIGKYDVVLSLEVGEHIPAEYESIFLNNLRDASSKYIVLSWAIEGQPGTGHVNCRNNEYVIKQMDKRSFIYKPELSEILRGYSSLPWFRNTIMVFEKWLQYF